MTTKKPISILLCLLFIQMTSPNIDNSDADKNQQQKQSADLQFEEIEGGETKEDLQKSQQSEPSDKKQQNPEKKDSDNISKLKALKAEQEKEYAKTMLELEKSMAEILKKSIQSLVKNPAFVENLEGKNPFHLLENKVDKLKDNSSKSLHDLSSFETIRDIEMKQSTPYMFLYEALIVKLDDSSSKKFLIFEFSSYVRLNFQLVLRSDPKIIENMGNIDFNEDVLIIDYSILKEFKDKYDLRIQQVLSFGSSISASFKSEDYLTGIFDKTLKINAQFASQIDILVSKEGLAQEQLAKPENRVQFILKTTMAHEELTGNEYFWFLVNSNQENFPSSEKNSLLSDGRVSRGLIKTINNKSEFYCLNKVKCEYKIRIYNMGVDKYTFLPSIFANNSIISFKNNVKAIEELEDKEIVQYTLSVPKNESDWTFEIDVIEGEVKSFLTPDQKPEELSKFLFKTQGKGKEVIYITSKEIKNQSWSGQLFHVGFECNFKEVPCSFNFEFKRVQNQFLKLEDNSLISGKLGRNDILNFEIDFYTGHSESYELLLYIQTGNFEIQTKARDCDFQDESKCLFTYQEWNSQKLNENTGQIMTKVQDGVWRLRFNCLGQNPFTNKSFYKNDWIISNKCKMRVGIKQEEEDRIDFRIRMAGETILKELQQNKIHQVQMFSQEKRRFKIPIQKLNPQNDKYLMIKGVLVEGEVGLFIGINDDQTDQDKFQKQLTLESSQDDKIKLTQQHLFINVEDQQDSFNLNVFISAQLYSVFDFSTTLTLDEKHSQIGHVEELQPNTAFLRLILKNTKAEFQGDLVYSSNFYIQIEKEYLANEYFEVLVNSDNIDLQICVQKDRKIVDFDRKCDFETQGTHLKVSKGEALQLRNLYSISIQKKQKPDHQFRGFPIQFSLIVQYPQGQEQLISVQPGIQTIKHIDPMQEMHFSLDLTKMKSFAYILFTTQTVFHEAYVMKDLKSNEKMASLNRDNFGLKIHNSEQFKRNSCQKPCYLYIKVISQDLIKNKFSLSFIVDDNLIHIKEGDQLFVPSNFEFYFFYKTKTKNFIFIDFNNEETESILYAEKHNSVYLEKDRQSLLNDNNSKYKSQLGVKGDIWMDKEYIESDSVNGVVFKIVPKINLINVTNGDIDVFSLKNKTSITLHSQYQILSPYQEITSQVFKGDLIFYQFEILEVQDFQIFLTLNSGNAQIYLTKGVNQYPSLIKYLKKGDSFHDKEILVGTKDFKNPSDIMGVYHLAVFGNETSMYSLLLANHFSSLRRIKFQELISIPLQKEQYYYLDYFNNHEIIDTYAYSDLSNVEIALFIYDKNKGQSFLQQVENEENVLQRFQLEKGGNPRKRLNMPGEKNTHYIIRLLSKENSQMDFAAYNNQSALNISVNKHVIFGMGKQEGQLFNTKLHKDYSVVNVEVHLEYGDIEVFVSDSFLFEPQDSKTISKKGKIKLQYKDTKAKHEISDIVIFNDIFVRVESNATSLFTIRVTIQNSFKLMRPFISELVQLSSKDEQFFYFTVNNKHSSETSKLSINIEHIQFFNPEPEFYYMADNDIALDADSPFLPMPIKDKYQKDINEVRQIRITVEPRHGMFIIKFPKGASKHLIKMNYTLNSDVVLDPNGIYHSLLPFTEAHHKFKVYLPSAGEFRFIFGKCSQVVIDSIYFIDSKGKREELKVNDQFAQSYPYLYLDQANINVQKLKELVVPIQRGRIKSSGILGIEIMKREHTEEDYFQITTEFLPQNKKLFLKDYIDFEGMNLKVVISHQFENKRLKMKVKMPKFKPQLLDDWDFNFIKLELVVNLIQNQEFQSELESCGLNVLSKFDQKRTQHSIVIKVNKEDLHREDFLEPCFDQLELQNFSKFPYFSVFSYLRVSILNNDDEELDISLNQRFSEVPYFVIRVKNLNKGGLFISSSYPQIDVNKVYLLLLFGLISFILYFVCRKRNQRVSMESQIKYDAPKTQTPKRLEIF